MKLKIQGFVKGSGKQNSFIFVILNKRICLNVFNVPTHLSLKEKHAKANSEWQLTLLNSSSQFGLWPKKLISSPAHTGAVEQLTHCWSFAGDVLGSGNKLCNNGQVWLASLSSQQQPKPKYITLLWSQIHHSAWVSPSVASSRLPLGWAAPTCECEIGLVTGKEQICSVYLHWIING